VLTSTNAIASFSLWKDNITSFCSSSTSCRANFLSGIKPNSFNFFPNQSSFSYILSLRGWDLSAERNSSFFPLKTTQLDPGYFTSPPCFIFTLILETLAHLPADAYILETYPDGNWRDGKRGRLYKSGIWKLVSYGEMKMDGNLLKCCRDNLFWIWKLEVWIGKLELEGHWEREALGDGFLLFGVVIDLL